MKLNSRTNVILLVIICLVPITFILLGNLFTMTETTSNNFSSELFFESNTSHTMIDINYIASGDFYFSTETDSYLKSFNPENDTEINQFRLSWGIVRKYAMNSYSGDLFFIVGEIFGSFNGPDQVFGQFQARMRSDYFT